MSQQRQQYQSMGVVGSNAGQFGDTTYTKIFVGGLAWETQRETMKQYFEQFGEILEAVVITDKSTGRSKGYGFVTFKDPDSAMRACQDPSPMIDGRRANCNLASLGAQKNRPPTPSHGMDSFRPRSWSMVPSPYRQPGPRMPSPYSSYGRYYGYPQDIQAMNYYSAYNGQQYSSPYTTAASGSPGVYYNYYPYYAQYGQQSSSTPGGYGMHYPQPVQYSYLPQQQSHGVAAFSYPTPPPSTSPVIITSTVGGETVPVAAVAGATGTASDQKSPA